MTLRFFQWLILTAFLLTLAVPSADVDGGSEPVGIRVFNSGAISLQSAISDDTFVIDYGSFQWMVLTKDDLPKLDAMGVTYQAIEAPYKLTLGGQSFDPLLSKPDFAEGWREVPARSGPGLRLIQFHGPTKEEWLKDLEGDGLTPIQYIYPFTYLVWGESDAVNAAAQRNFVRWTGDFLPAYAVQNKNRSLGSDPIQFRAMTLPQAGLDKIIAALEALGASQVASASGFDPAFDLVSFILPGDQVWAAASLPGIYSIQPVPTDGGDRGEMSNQVNVGNIDASNRAIPGYQTWLGQLGLSGNGVVIANVDSGIDEMHPDLVSRMTGCIGLSCGGSASNHGTHTAGIMAGDGSSGVRDVNGFLRGLGMAPEANLVEQVYDPIYQQENGMLTLMTESYRNGAVISGNSWGPSGTPQGYDYDTRLVDIGVRDADPDTPGNQALTYVLSIMNGNGGTSTQGTPDEAKNTFTIGSTYMQNNDSSGSQRLNINDLSSNTAHGPALDGRIIPHMVAPGCYVDSTFMTSSYGLMCGTSMASPQVSGAAALFFEQYRNQHGVDPSPALVKAAFLPATHDLAGNKDAVGGILGHPFDARQGWGRLDADAVLDPAMSVLYYDQEIIFQNTGEFWGFSINGELDELRAMLVWTDAPGHGLGGETPAWVNDLDLSVSVNGQTYYGNNFGLDGLSIPGGSPDMMNNTEGIFLRNLKSDIVTLTVTAGNIAGDGVPNLGDGTDQDFAIAVYYSLSGKTYQYILPIIYR